MTAKGHLRVAPDPTIDGTCIHTRTRGSPMQRLSLACLALLFACGTDYDLNLEKEDNAEEEE